MSETILTASSSRKFVRAWTSGCIGAASCSQGHGRVNAKLAGNRMSSIATCSSTCRWRYRTGKKLRQVEAAITRLVKRHGRGITDERVIKLVIHDNPDGKYLIKGGGTKIWKRFRLRNKHRRLQGLICGKRCGVTENIGLAARKRWSESRERSKREAA